MKPNHKAARRICDQYHCHYCGKQWDHDDPDPPECVRAESEAYTPKKRYKSNPGCTPGNPCGRCILCL